ncbi:MAG: type II toxin-antitoxin system VapC family toxin [Sinimarinibacterium flocculans]|uniref:type II toxin-antitoxin system VapC family toxin n=1 Tax=Sinimarinibacterium flocculans TaxID=985250 RepID=UPI003C5C4977
MNVVDSSAWLEYFADGPNADFFARPIEKPDGLLVPSITVLEVFKRVAQQRDEGAALQCVAVMQQGEVVELDAALALRAAAVGLRHKLPLADSVVYATAQAANATVWTQDGDFEGLPGVKFRAKRA